MKTDTAHEAWEETWKSEQGRMLWEEAEHQVLRLVPLLNKKSFKRVLDLGSGIGRHSLVYAANDFEVTAFDASESGLNHLQGLVKERGFSVKTVQGEMTQLPFEDDAFDFVVSWNVLYHGDANIVSKALSEVRRVLKPGGLFQSTFLSKRSKLYGEGTEISPNTWVLDEAISDKTHPHYYMNANELLDIFAGFEVVLLELESEENENSPSLHWHVVAEKL